MLLIPSHAGPSTLFPPSPPLSSLVSSLGGASAISTPGVYSTAIRNWHSEAQGGVNFKPGYSFSGALYTVQKVILRVAPGWNNPAEGVTCQTPTSGPGAWTELRFTVRHITGLTPSTGTFNTGGLCYMSSGPITLAATAYTDVELTGYCPVCTHDCIHSLYGPSPAAPVQYECGGHVVNSALQWQYTNTGSWAPYDGNLLSPAGSIDFNYVRFGGYHLHFEIWGAVIPSSPPPPGGFWASMGCEGFVHLPNKPSPLSS